MAKCYIGTCTECGEEDVEVTLIDEDTSLCDDCLDALDYIECDECNEFWLWDAVKFYHLKDGRTLCEGCAEDLLADQKLDKEKIDFIEDHTI